MNGALIIAGKIVLMSGVLLAVYANGRRDGRRQGFRDGFKKGFLDGERMGYKAGYPIGTLEGARRERKFANTDALQHFNGCCCAACRAKVM